MSELATDQDFDIDAGPIVSADEAAPAPVIEKDTSLDDIISKAFDDQVANLDESGQPRDDLGRFAAKTAQEAADRATAALKDDAAQKPVTDPATGEMPASWGRDKAALWAKTDPEVRAYIAERERQVSEGFRQYEGLAEFAEGAKGNGLTLRDVMGRVRELETMVVQDPVRALHEIFTRSNIDPKAVARAFLGVDDQGGQAVPAYQAPAIDPQVSATIQQLQQEVSSLRIQPILREVEAFASDPSNKHFDTVSDSIKALIANDRNLSLKEAYDRACWAHPQVRAELLQAQNAPVIKAQQLAKSTQMAERASRGLTPSASQPVRAAPKSMSIDEAINAALALQE